MSTTDRFYFTKEELQNTPSRKSGIDPEKEQSYRQQSATLIQDMGQRLSVYPCILSFVLCVFVIMIFASFSLMCGNIVQKIPTSFIFVHLDNLCRSQLTINTAIVYVHRFYMFHSFTKFHRNVS